MTRFNAENNLVVIPSRSGSKRVPDKNIRYLGGKPLMAWSIEQAINNSLLGDVVVSTDSESYASIAKEYGGHVPKLRSNAHSQDDSPTADAILETLNQYEKIHNKKIEWITLLQATSPFRSGDTLTRAIERFFEFDGDTVVSVSPNRIPASWQIDIGSKHLLIEAEPLENKIKKYHYNGSVYIFLADTLRETGDIYSSSIRTVVVESTIESIDVDTEEDWLIAQALAHSMEHQLLANT